MFRFWTADRSWRHELADWRRGHGQVQLVNSQGGCEVEHEQPPAFASGDTHQNCGRDHGQGQRDRSDEANEQKEVFDETSEVGRQQAE
jgi:hypothetical protein